MAFSVVLEGGSPWGFRLQGGVDFNEPVKIAKINPNSKASAKGVQVGDYLDKINNTNTEGLSHHEVQQLMKNAGNTLALELCKPDARISRSDTRLNSLPLPARSAAPTSNTQLHATMNGDVRGVPHNRDVRGHADPYIMNNNEGENTIKPYKPTSLSGPPESFHNSDVSQHYSSTTVEDLSGPSQNLAAEQSTKSKGLSLFLRRQEQCKEEGDESKTETIPSRSAASMHTGGYMTLPSPRRRAAQQSSSSLKPVSPKPVVNRPGEQPTSSRPSEVKGRSIPSQPSLAQMSQGVQRNDPHLSPSLRRLQRRFEDDEVDYESQKMGHHHQSVAQGPQQSVPVLSPKASPPTPPKKSVETRKKTPSPTVPRKKLVPIPEEENPFKVQLKSTNQHLWSESGDPETSEVHASTMRSKEISTEAGGSNMNASQGQAPATTAPQAACQQPAATGPPSQQLAFSAPSQPAQHIAPTTASTQSQMSALETPQHMPQMQPQLPQAASQAPHTMWTPIQPEAQTVPAAQGVPATWAAPQPAAPQPTAPQPTAPQPAAQSTPASWAAPQPTAPQPEAQSTPASWAAPQPTAPQPAAQSTPASWAAPQPIAPQPAAQSTSASWAAPQPIAPQPAAQSTPASWAAPQPTAPQPAAQSTPASWAAPQPAAPQPAAQSTPASVASQAAKMWTPVQFMSQNKPAMWTPHPVSSAAPAMWTPTAKAETLPSTDKQALSQPAPQPTVATQQPQMTWCQQTSAPQPLPLPQTSMWSPAPQPSLQASTSLTSAQMSQPAWQPQSVAQPVMPAGSQPSQPVAQMPQSMRPTPAPSMWTPTTPQPGQPEQNQPVAMSPHVSQPMAKPPQTMWSPPAAQPDASQTLPVSSQVTQFVWSPSAPSVQTNMTRATTDNSLSSQEQVLSTVVAEVPGVDQQVSNPTSQARSSAKIMSVNELFRGTLQRIGSVEETPPQCDSDAMPANNQDQAGGKSTDIYTNSEPKPGIWSPGQSSQPLLNHDINNTDEQNVTGTDKTDIVPVWSPTGETNTVRKEFRPVRLDTNVRKVADKTHKPGEYTAKETFAWKPSPSPSMETSPSTSTITTTTTTSTIGSPTVTTSTTSTAHWNGNISNMEDSKSGLPKPQSPTITLLQKGREGQLPKGAVYVGTKEVVDGDVKHIDTYYMAPSEEKVTTVTKIEKKAPKYEGIGPQTGEGMPMGLKTTIDEEHQKDWYKKMYKSIHKTERPKDQNTYTPTYVFPSDSESEKEEPPNPYVPSYEYPSKFTHKDDRPWTNLDKMDPSVNDKKFTHEGYGKGPMSYAHARSRLEIYKNQPRSITEYEPGFSSIAFKEAKTDDTSDDKGILYNPPIEKPGQFSRYTIKDHSGSEPDIRKTNRDPRSISPTDSHEAYKIIQKGGEIPLSGLRLPAPDKVEKSSPKKKKVPTATLR